MKLAAIACPVCTSAHYQTAHTCRIEKKDFPFHLKELSLVRCLGCGLLYANPRLYLDEEEARKAYGVDYFDSVYMRFYGGHEEENGFQTNEGFPQRLDLIEKFVARGQLLEIGCASGAFLGFARSRGWQVFGVEVSPYASDIARKKLGLDVVTGDLKTADFKKDFFDVVACSDVLEHIEDPVDFLSGIRKILKDDGVVYMAMPNAASLYYRVFGLLNFLNRKNYFLLPYHIVHYSPKTLKVLLEKTGFELAYCVLSNSKPLARAARRMFIDGLNAAARRFKMQDRIVAIAKKGAA